jgi:RNA polymerase sigma-70 factor, ECF subfamily
LTNPLLEHSELAWLADLKSGKEDALRAIFDQHYAALVGDAQRLIRDTDTCRDLAQEVFVELWRKREHIEVHSSLRAYLRRAVVNKALNHLKSSQKFLFTDADDLDSPEDSFAATLAQENQDNLEAALHAAVESLPEKCRIVFSLSRFEDMTHKEIADRLQISVKTIENQITKAMKILRETMIAYRELSSIVILLALWQ